ncbi:MAG TPA: hypothetical protein VG013_06430, partial [Gemmataceae bacterium]|nr:hypothetical protein [Gemmataceae bacterium]
LEPDYRVPYDLSNDYWLYDRYARLAASEYDTLLIGDSVIWGQYVTRQQTLSHYLNELAGRERFANLGLDGADPASLAGLLEHYAGGVEGKNVVLLCNPLWMSSPTHDLQEEDEEVRFSHPELLPQFVPRIPAYKEETSRRIGHVIDRNVPFTGWTEHLQQAYFDRMSIPKWTLEHPSANPLKQLKQGLPPSDNLLRHQPIPWTKQGIKPQGLPWVELEQSFQWRSFQRALGIMERRANRVFVLVGPFNEHMLNAASRRRYAEIKQGIGAWLEEKHVAHAIPRVLPSKEYADLSHPLKEGYKRLARRLFAERFFK